MYAITGITGQVGGALARTLLAAGQPVRAVVRDTGKGQYWKELGCELACADMADAIALAAAFSEVQGAFVLLPPTFDPTSGFSEARAYIAAVKSALATARPERVVCLSTIGAQAEQVNLLTQLSLMEESLSELDLPICFLRPAWFMENAAWDIASAREQGVIASFLQPLDKAVPMVATADVGRVAAGLLHERWCGKRIVELEGPCRITPNVLAATLGKILDRGVRAEAVPRPTWGDLFTSQGMNNPLPRMRMLDGFNKGWIDFAGHTVKGRIELESVLLELARRN
jgi:uncharacterized protein YbjT (DUF2867 family)